MLEKYMETELGVRESADQLQGIDLGDGNIKTRRGTIRTPKSRLQTSQKNPEVIEAPVHSEVQAQPAKLKTTPVVIHSDFGDITYNCVDVVKTGEYLVLEMSQDNFTPKSYSEAPELRLPISWEGNKGTFVFTGCRWKQRRSGMIFIVLLEVKEQEVSYDA